MSKAEKFILVGKAYWSCVHAPNDKSNKYQLDLSIDALTAKGLKAQGIDVKDKGDDRNLFVTIKSTLPPKVVDSHKNAIPATVLIGNGSEVRVVAHIYQWTFAGKKGSSLSLDAVQILNLVSYDPLDVVNDGYVAPTSSKDALDALDNPSPPSLTPKKSSTTRAKVTKIDSDQSPF